MRNNDKSTSNQLVLLAHYILILSNSLGFGLSSRMVRNGVSEMKAMMWW